MLQRVKFANVMAVYRLLRNDLYSLFESQESPRRTSRASTYYSFTGASLRRPAVFLTRKQAQDGTCIAAPYCVSEGVLPSVKIVNDASGARTDILLGDLRLTPETTVARFSEAVIRRNGLYVQGDTIVYVHLLQTLPSDTGIPCVTPFFHRLRLDTDDERPMRLLVPMLGFSSRDGYLAQEPTDDPCAFAWVHMRPCATGMHVSTQNLSVRNPLFDRYASPEAARAAMSSYRV